eukprot:TRINITY_DN6804_c0_g1_i5.p1 TRINITY_DN6804_c0_g1~~TRINITY_DN6804_c0_g1_i5.p1  ORF type:complete len:209 (-),score=45.04 TRINITY_DN6804_c0_g1_i5:176-802(-)
MKIYSNSKDAKLKEIYDEMIYNEIEPDDLVVTGLLENFRDEISVLSDLLRKMIRPNSKPTVRIFNALIDVQGRSGNKNQVRTTYNEMVQRGLHPNLFTFSSLFSIFRGEMEIVEEYFEEMKTYGIQPNISIFNIIIETCGKARDKVKAKSTYELIVKSRVVPNLETFNLLIKIFLGDSETVEYFLVEMTRCGLKPSTDTIHLLLETQS